MKDIGFQQLNGVFRNGFIKSIQGLTITGTSDGSGAGTQTITAIDPNNTIVLASGGTTTTASGGGPVVTPQWCGRLSMTSTSVTAIARSTPLTAQLTIIEFFPGVIRSVQRGTISINADTQSGTATIAQINTAKSIVLHFGVDDSYTTYNLGCNIPQVTDRMFCWKFLLNDSTTVQASRSAAVGNAAVVGYQVVEWF